MTNIHIAESADAVAQYMADQLVEMTANLDRDFHISLSGGSTPKRLFKLLQESYANALDWHRLHWWWGDERLVMPTDPESNYGVVKKLLFDHVDVPGLNIHRVKGELSPDDALIEYEEALLNHLPKQDGKPTFDLMMLGMGDDGHTASIFPDQMELLKSERLCALAKHPVSGQIRVSLTGHVINQSSQIIFLVTGAGKADVLSTILEQKTGFEQYPAAHIDAINGQLSWFIDSDAASGLMH